MNGAYICTGIIAATDPAPLVPAHAGHVGAGVDLLHLPLAGGTGLQVLLRAPLGEHGVGHGLRYHASRVCGVCRVKCEE